MNIGSPQTALRSPARRGVELAWSYDFVEDRTHEGRNFHMLCFIHEFARDALAILVKRQLNAMDVLASRRPTPIVIAGGQMR